MLPSMCRYLCDHDSCTKHAAMLSDRLLTGTAAKQTPINYFSRAQSGRLSLLQGDSDSFSDVLTLIGEYEGQSRF